MADQHGSVSRCSVLQVWIEIKVAAVQQLILLQALGLQNNQPFNKIDSIQSPKTSISRRDACESLRDSSHLL
jgi:hypothetical protein